MKMEKLLRLLIIGAFSIAISGAIGSMTLVILSGIFTIAGIILLFKKIGEPINPYE